MPLSPASVLHTGGHMRRLPSNVVLMRSCFYHEWQRVFVYKKSPFCQPTSFFSLAFDSSCGQKYDPSFFRLCVKRKGSRCRTTLYFRFTVGHSSLWWRLITSQGPSWRKQVEGSVPRAGIRAGNWNARWNSIDSLWLRSRWLLGRITPFHFFLVHLDSQSCLTLNTSSHLAPPRIIVDATIWYSEVMMPARHF